MYEDNMFDHFCDLAPFFLRKTIASFLDTGLSSVFPLYTTIEYMLRENRRSLTDNLFGIASL